jgi:stage II sporulation protein D
MLFLCLCLFLLVGSSILRPAQAGPPPATPAEATSSSHASLTNLTRWNMDYGTRMVDTGRYLEALAAFRSASRSAPTSALKGEALMRAALVLANYLDTPTEALTIFRQVVEAHPSHADSAFFQQGALLLKMRRFAESAKTLERYPWAFPQGRFIFQAEQLLDETREALETERRWAGQPMVRLATKLMRKPEIEEQPEVRVLLQRTAHRLRVKGESLSLRTADKGQIWQGDQVVMAFQKGQGVVFQEGWTDATPAPKLKEPFTLTALGPMEIHVDGPPPKPATLPIRTVRGYLRVEPREQGLWVVNPVPLESLLRDVSLHLTREDASSGDWPMEALKSMSVVTRTYILHQVLHRSSWDYDLAIDSGALDYKGVLGAFTAMDRAVELTRGEVLIVVNEHGQRQPIFAAFNQNNGGQLVDPEDVAGWSPDYLRARRDRYSKRTPWTRRMPLAEMERRLALNNMPIAGFSGIQPLQRSEEGQILQVQMLPPDKGFLSPAYPLLNILMDLPGPPRQIAQEESMIAVSGEGLGTGWGYSIDGGHMMARAGYSYRRILAFYYHNTKLGTFW